MAPTADMVWIAVRQSSSERERGGRAVNIRDMPQERLYMLLLFSSGRKLYVEGRMPSLLSD